MRLRANDRPMTLMDAVRQACRTLEEPFSCTHVVRALQAANRGAAYDRVKAAMGELARCNELERISPVRRRSEVAFARARLRDPDTPAQPGRLVPSAILDAVMVAWAARRPAGAIAPHYRRAQEA